MKILPVALAIFFLSIAGQSHGSRDLSLVTDTFPPYYYEEDGKAYGIQYELITATLKKMNRALQLNLSLERELFLPQKTRFQMQFQESSKQATGNNG